PVFPLPLAWLPPPPPPEPAPVVLRPVEPPPSADAPPAEPQDALVQARLAIVRALGPDAPPEITRAVAEQSFDDAAAAAVQAPPAAAEPPSPVPAPPTPPPWTWSACLPWLAGLWFAGAAGWFAWAGITLWAFQRLLRHARPAPPEVQTQARRLAESLGLARCPTVLLLPGALPPMIWAAVGRARLFFPADLL